MFIHLGHDVRDVNHGMPRSPQPPKRLRRQPDNALERPGEMKRVVEAQLGSDLFDKDTRDLKSLGGQVHLQPHEKAVGTLVIVATEQAAQVSPVDPVFACHLFCARVRQEYDQVSGGSPGRITVEQVRSAMDVWLEAADLAAGARRARFQAELEKQQYHQHRNQQARVSHAKTRIDRLTAQGIDVSQIKSCILDTHPP